MSFKKKPSPELDNYEKFLDLQKDTDLCLSELEDAKKRLVELKSH